MHLVVRSYPPCTGSLAFLFSPCAPYCSFHLPSDRALAHAVCMPLPSLPYSPWTHRLLPAPLFHGRSCQPPPRPHPSCLCLHCQCFPGHTASCHCFMAAPVHHPLVLTPHALSCHAPCRPGGPCRAHPCIKTFIPTCSHTSRLPCSICCVPHVQCDAALRNAEAAALRPGPRSTSTLPSWGSGLRCRFVID